MTDTIDLKQAALDLASAAGKIFDGIEEHGVEAPWKSNEVLMALVQMRNSYDAIAGFFSLQAAMRMRALGISPEEMARRDYRDSVSRPDGGSRSR